MSIVTMGNGYLSPKGNIFYGSHADVAFRFYGHTKSTGVEVSMEIAGWWKLCSVWRATPTWIGWLPATAAQQRFITE